MNSEQYTSTYLWGGTSLRTSEPAATMDPLPTLMLPRMVAPAPMSTPSWTLGCRSPASLPVPPSVTPCRRQPRQQLERKAPEKLLRKVPK